MTEHLLTKLHFLQTSSCCDLQMHEDGAVEVLGWKSLEDRLGAEKSLLKLVIVAVPVLAEFDQLLTQQQLQQQKGEHRSENVLCFLLSKEEVEQVSPDMKASVALEDQQERHYWRHQEFGDA